MDEGLQFTLDDRALERESRDRHRLGCPWHLIEEGQPEELIVIIFGEISSERRSGGGEVADEGDRAMCGQGEEATQWTTHSVY